MRFPGSACLQTEGCLGELRFGHILSALSLHFWSSPHLPPKTDRCTYCGRRWDFSVAPWYLSPPSQLQWGASLTQSLSKQGPQRPRRDEGLRGGKDHSLHRGRRSGTWERWWQKVTAEGGWGRQQQGGKGRGRGEAGKKKMK